MKKTIHEKISDYRKLKGLTQEQLGAILSVSGQAVSKWEKGESMPDIMILPELCKTFGISVDTLLDVPYMENKENIIKETACFAKDYGREKVLHDIMSLTFNDVENRISGNAVDFSNTSLRVFDGRGMGFFITNRMYMEKCFEYDINDISSILKFLSDEYTLKVLQCITPDIAMTKEEIEQKTNCDSLKINEVLLEMIERQYICKEYDNSGKCGYLSTEKMFVVYMVLSGMMFLKKDNIGLMWFSRNRNN